jgi:hypothetical protein
MEAETPLPTLRSDAAAGVSMVIRASGATFTFAVLPGMKVTVNDSPEPEAIVAFVIRFPPGIGLWPRRVPLDALESTPIALASSTLSGCRMAVTWTTFPGSKFATPAGVLRINTV